MKRFDMFDGFLAALLFLILLLMLAIGTASGQGLTGEPNSDTVGILFEPDTEGGQSAFFDLVEEGTGGDVVYRDEKFMIVESGHVAFVLQHTGDDMIVAGILNLETELFYAYGSQTFEVLYNATHRWGEVVAYVNREKMQV